MNSCFSLSSTFVKVSSRTASVAFLLLVMCVPGVVRGAVMDMKTNLDAITSMREAGIEMANKPLAEIRTKYHLALQQHQKVAREGGDLNGVLAVTTALELLKSGAPFSPLSADPKIAKGVEVKMCWIPPGEFVMGSPEVEMGRRDEETQHKVIITQGFWLGKYEVTQEQWQAVMGNNPSKFNGKNLPVEQVSWNMISGSGGFLEKANNNATTGERFHLPTEAQWEYACRAGTQTSLNNGKEITTANGDCRNLHEVAWYKANSEGKTHPVGKNNANAWSMQDMHGNVWELCKDWKGTYPTGAVTDPQGADSSPFRVVRGGCWNNDARFCRTAYRYHNYKPSNISSSIGFRLARSSAP